MGSNGEGGNIVMVVMMITVMMIVYEYIINSSS